MTAEAKLKLATQALEKIASVKYGLEINDSDEVMLAHFAKQCRDYEYWARTALSQIREGKTDG